MMMKKLMLKLLCLSLWLSPAAGLIGQINYSLDSTGISHLFWPFGSGTSYNARVYYENGSPFLLRMARGHEAGPAGVEGQTRPSGALGPGSGCHNKEDYWAQDWRLCPMTDPTCHYYNNTGDGNVVIYSPVYGRILNYDDVNSDHCGLGGQINIEVLNEFMNPTGFGLQIIHVFDGSVSARNIEVGDLIIPGTPLALIGQTGSSAGPDYPHMHIALYKNLYKNVQVLNCATPPSYVSANAFDILSFNCSPVCGSCFGNYDINDHYAVDFRLDATQVAPTNGCYGYNITLSNNVNGPQICIAENSLDHDPGIAVQSSGDAIWVAPRVTLSGINIQSGGRLLIQNGFYPERTGPKESPEVVLEESLKLESWPNPFSQKLQLRLSPALHEIRQVTLYDLTGRAVFTHIPQGYIREGQLAYILKTSHLKDGIYLLKATLEDGTVLSSKVHKVRS